MLKQLFYKITFLLNCSKKKNLKKIASEILKIVTVNYKS